MLKINLNQLSNPKIIINLFFCLIPLSFIIGNLAININITLLSVLSLFFFKEKIFLQEKTFLDKLIYFFFIYILLVLIINLIELNFFKVLIINHFDNFNLYLISKTIFFFRYLILYFVLKFLIQEDIINLKYFFFISSFLCLFVSLDIFFQLIFNYDIFGFEPIHPRKLSGPFGPELIAGSYLQKFYLFFIPLILFFSFKKKYNFVILIFIILNLIAIIFSGNRMPLLLSVLGIIIYAIYEIRIRKLLFSSFLIFVVLFLVIYSNNIEVRNNFGSFKHFVSQSFTLINNKKIERNLLPRYYYNEFESFYDTWQMNKYFGGSVKSFRIFCPYRKNVDLDERQTCNTHPHNYYLEILTDIGLIGLIIILTIFFTLIKNIVKLFLDKKFLIKHGIIFPFFLLFFLEIFPIKNTGSFFSTWNTTFIFFLMGCLSGFSKKKLEN